MLFGSRLANAGCSFLNSSKFSNTAFTSSYTVASGTLAEATKVVVVDRNDELVWKSMRNIPEVHLLASDQLNTYDVLVSDYVVFTEATLPGAAGSTETEAAS